MVVSPLFISIVITIAFLVFYVAFVWVSISSEATPFHVFWLPFKTDIVSPYFTVVAVLVLLWALVIAFFLMSFKQRQLSRGKMVFALIASVVLFSWTIGMWQFWRAMAFERGEITAEDWFDEETLPLYSNRGVDKSGRIADDWFLSVDPVKLATTDLANGVIRFFERCGYACLVPEVDFMTYEHCFPSVTIEHIGPRGDVIKNDEDSMMMTKASEFAARYNKIVRFYLEAKGITECGPGEDWNLATETLGIYIENLPGGMRGRRSRIGSPWSIHRRGRDYLVQLSGNNWNQDVYAGICLALGEGDLQGKMSISLISPPFSNEVRNGKLICEDGGVVSLTEEVLASSEN